MVDNRFFIMLTFHVMQNLKEIRGWLALNIGQWPDFARCSGVPYSTLEKVARGTTKNPRLQTYDRLEKEYLRRKERELDKNTVGKQ